MSAATFAFTAFKFRTASSLADLMFCLTFSTAVVASARAFCLRTSILSCASFCAAEKASSACFARTDRSASCSENFFMGVLHWWDTEQNLEEAERMRWNDFDFFGFDLLHFIDRMLESIHSRVPPAANF